MKSPFRIVAIMAIILGLSVSTAAVALAAAPPGVGAPDQQTEPRANGSWVRMIVEFEPEVFGTPAADRSVAAVGARVIRTLEKRDVMVLSLPEGAVEALGAREGVAEVLPDALVYATAKPPWANGGNDEDDSSSGSPRQDIPWNIERVGAHDTTWGVSTGKDIDVAVIDSGIDAKHEDLKPEGGILLSTADQYRRYRNDPTSWKAWNDDNGHGTHVAGIVGALDNNVGVVGVAPDADLWAVKVLTDEGWGYTSDVVAGVDWATATRTDDDPSNDIDVINMSLGGGSYWDTYEQAINDAYNAGILVVSSAGNGGPDDGTVGYPARYDNVVAVGSTTKDDEIFFFSARGTDENPLIDLVAPGEVLSTVPGGYDTYGGTSMSSPHIAGGAAVYLAENPTAKPDAVLHALKTNAQDLSAFEKEQGAGLLRVDGALEISP